MRIEGNMTEEFLRDVVNRFPSACACHQIILNDKGLAEDFVIFDMNRAFEEMTGLQKDIITGKRVTEAFIWLKNSDFDWVGFFEKAASNIGQETVFLMDFFGVRYKMTVYSPQRTVFLTLFEKAPRSGKINEETSGRRFVTLHNNRCFPRHHRMENKNIRMVGVYSPSMRYKNEPRFPAIFGAAERERYKDDLYRQSELLKITFASIGDGVVATNKEGQITLLNKSAQEITGWLNEEVQGRKFADIFKLTCEETGMTIEDPIDIVLQTGKIVANHAVLINKQGRCVPVADSAAPIRDEDGEIFGVVMVFRDVSRDREQQNCILDLSYRDSLTGLNNRRFLLENISRLDTRAKSAAGSDHR